MSQAAMLRFLDLVCKELGASDARAELGGRDPDDARLLWTPLPGGFRLVAVFAQPLVDRAQKQEQLAELVHGFSHTLREGALPAPPSPPVESAFKRLDLALEGLRSRTGSACAVIIDAHSPALWGISDARRPEQDVHELARIGNALRAGLDAGIELDAICALEGPDLPGRLRELGIGPAPAAALAGVLGQGDESDRRRRLLTCLAIARARREVETERGGRWAHHESQFGYFVRGFANIYLLVLVFEGAFSELYVESAVVHALPGVEHLVLALPPIDPGPRGGRVIPLRR